MEEMNTQIATNPKELKKKTKKGKKDQIWATWVRDRRVRMRGFSFLLAHTYGRKPKHPN
jgi:hypothetical protein